MPAVCPLHVRMECGFLTASLVACAMAPHLHKRRDSGGTDRASARVLAATEGNGVRAVELDIGALHRSDYTKLCVLATLEPVPRFQF